MSRRMLVSMMVLALALAAIGAGTWAAFSDTETSTGNTFTAGTLDLTIDGQNDPISGKFSASNLKPGDYLDAGVVTLHNAGTVDGKLSVVVSNVVNQENELLEPEVAAGDKPDYQYDTTGYNADAGFGELWDQCTFVIYFDRNNNNQWDWNDYAVWSGPFTDLSGYYRIPLDVNLVPSLMGGYGGTWDGIMHPGDDARFGVMVRFNNGPDLWGHGPGMTNNQAMDDSFTFDLKVGLDQLH